MKFTDYITESSIIIDLKAKDKEGVLREIVDTLKERGVLKGEGPYLEALVEREKLCSTGIGRGVAIPHAKLKGIDTILVSFARSKEGVDFEALDKRPVHFFFTIFTPEDVPEEYLVLLARISRIAKDEGFRRAVLEAETPQEIIRIFKEKDEEFEKEAVG